MEAYSIDGSKPVDLTLKAGQRQIDLSAELEETDDGAAKWSRIDLYGDLRVPEETVDTVFPVGERRTPPGKLYVAVRCHQTILRDRVETENPFDGPGEYDLVVRLRKERVRGTVELHPYLVRTEEGEESDRFASEPNVRLASGDPYTVVVDSPEEADPAIDGEEVSFSRAPHLPDGNKLYYLDFRNESRPKLWINADHPRITDVLQAKGSVGATPRMRDVILDQISYGVWTQLFVRAATALDSDGGVEHDWQRTVLETFTPNLYDVADADEATYRLRRQLEDDGGLARVLTRFDEELQEYLDPRHQLINLMEEGLKI